MGFRNVGNEGVYIVTSRTRYPLGLFDGWHVSEIMSFPSPLGLFDPSFLAPVRSKLTSECIALAELRSA